MLYSQSERLFSHVSPVCDANKKIIFELEKKVNNDDNQKNIDMMFEALEKKMNVKLDKFGKREIQLFQKLQREC